MGPNVRHKETAGVGVYKLQRYEQHGWRNQKYDICNKC